MTELPRTAMLFAAGFGTRMRPLTLDRPKPLLQVAGRTLLDRTLALAQPHVDRIVVNTHYRAPQIEAHLRGRDDVQVLHEAPDILDTGGGLKNALPVLGSGPVYTLNTDAVFNGPDPLTMLRDAWQPRQMDALLLLCRPQRAVRHAGAGDFEIDEQGRLRRGPGLIYTGVQIVNPAGLSQIPDRVFSLNLLWDRLLDQGRLYGAVYGGWWCDVGTPEGIDAAETLLDSPVA